MSVELVPFGRLFAPAKRLTVGTKDVPILSITMADGLVDQAERFKKRIASLDISQYKRVQRNQLVVGFPINEGVIAFQRKYDEAGVSPAYVIWDVQPGMSIHHEYVERVLRSPEMCTRYETKMRGTAGRRRNMPKDELEKVPIPLPPLAEQKRIAGILDAADALRAKRREALAQLDTLLQATFLDLFGDPVTNPKGWETSTLGAECSEICNGQSIKQSDGAGGVAISRIETISEGVVNPKKVGFAGLQAVEAAKHLLRHGDILFSHINSSAHLCKCAIYLDEHGPLVHGMNLLRLRTSKRLNSFFLLYLIKCGSYRATLMKHENPAVNQSSIAASKIKLHQCPVPPIDLQCQFAEIVKGVERQRAKHHAHLAELDTLFASLQSRAFRGEL